MAEGRMLKKIISTSKKLADLKSDSARLLYTWLLPHLDVEGRFSADPNIVKGYVVPRLRMSAKKIKEYLDDMAINGLVILYEKNGDRYLQLNKFKDFQILREDREKESLIPVPNGKSVITPGVPQENADTIKDKIIKDKLIKDKGDFEKEFEEFWVAYREIEGNKDDIGDKQEALKAYKTLRKKEEKATIVRATNGYADYLKCKRLEEHFNQRKKFASTFLRSEKWKRFLDFKYKGRL